MNLKQATLAALGGTAFLAGSAGAQISFQNSQTLSLLGQRPDWVATGDFNGATGPDFAVTTGSPQGVNGPDWVEIFMNQGNGAFTAGQQIFLGNNVGSAAVVAADFDGDSDMDLAVSLKDINTVQILFNTGGTFALGGSVAVGGLEPRHMTAGDFDEDGDMDLVTSNRDSNNLSLLTNNGAGGFAMSGTLAVGLDPRYVVLEDLNGDCSLDLAVSAQDSRRVDIMMGTGTGAFGGVSSVLIPFNEKPSGLVAADLDGDFDVDLVASSDNNGIGILCVLSNNGAGMFSAACFNTGGQNPGGVIAADLDADGDKDLATADEDSNFVSALPNLGGGIFGAGSSTPVGANPSHLACADLDGNGSIDLITPNRDSNNVSVLLNNGTGGAKAYCTASPNSMGAGARIDSTGTLSIAANQFTVTARCAPASQTGVFFYGGGTQNVPFGNGRLCVQSPFFRLNPPLTIDGAGHASRLVDFTSPPADTSITAGSTWYFQFWYRDPVAGGSFFNLSDGLSATFNP